MTPRPSLYRWMRRVVCPLGAHVAILGLVLVGCRHPEKSSDSAQSRPHFLEKSVQDATERTMLAALEAVDSINLSDYEFFQASQIAVDMKSIYVASSRSGKVIAIQRDNPLKYRIIGSGKGQGPGEVEGLQSFWVDANHIYWHAGHKVVRWTKDGTHEDQETLEYRVKVLRLLSTGEYLGAAPFDTEYLFSVFDTSGQRIRGFELKNRTDYNLLHYDGWFATDDRFVYWAGFPESLIKKYTINGDLQYSVATIDNFPGEQNYIEFGTDGATGMGYAEYGLFSSLAIVPAGDYLILIPPTDGDLNRLSLLDLYRAADGAYVGTYEVESPTQKISVDGNTLYTLERGTDGDMYVKRYEGFFGDVEARLGL